jgi:deazaflavin-dependent oxidoreductase (nitroreductase family)
MEDFLMRIVATFVRILLELGVALGPMVLLSVPGRKTGVLRTNPVDMFESDGRYWLIATHSADASWVRNLRATGRGTLRRGRRRFGFIATELSSSEAAAVLEKVVGPRLARRVAGLVLRQTLGLRANATQLEFEGAAETHPVFEVVATSMP